MALQNITSGPFEAMLIRTSRKAIKNTVIEGANPRLYSALLQVTSNANHVKKLNLDSATELIALLDDAETLNKVFEADKRVYVKEAVNRRLIEIGVRAAPEYRTRYIPTLSPAVTTSTEVALRKPYIQAVQALTNLRQYDEALVTAWTETVQVEALPLIMDFVGRSNYYFASGILAEAVAKRLAVLTADELTTLLRGHRVPSSVFEAYIAERPSEVDAAAAVIICHAEEYSVSAFLLADAPASRVTVSEAAVEIWRQTPRCARYVLFAGALPREELTSLLDNAEYADANNRSGIMRYARTASDADFVVSEALRRGWWSSNEAHFPYAYATSEISGLLSVEGISEATALAIIARSNNSHIVRYALGEWGVPHRSAYEKVVSKMTLNRIGWFSDLESAVARLGSEQTLLGFTRDFVATSTTLVEEVRHSYHNRSATVVASSIADVLHEKLGDNTVSWSMFLSLCEDAEDVTLLNLAEAASSLV
jgi:hypothetical protein